MVDLNVIFLDGMWFVVGVIELLVVDVYVVVVVYFGCLDVFIVWMDVVVIDENDLVVIDFEFDLFDECNGLLYLLEFISWYCFV